MRLLGVLLGVGLVVGLSAFVVSRVTDQGAGTTPPVGVTVGPGGEVRPASEGGATAEGGAPDAAQTVACATTARSLRDAEESYRVLNGSYADLATLVQSGTIRAPAQDLYGIESGDGFTTFRLIGRHGCP
jgi:hypothetical protein